MKLSLLFYLFKLNSINSLSYTPYKYPYDPRIHNFGNVGIGGKFHANLARPITKVDDDSYTFVVNTDTATSGNKSGGGGLSSAGPVTLTP